jgi:hypothetical protein
MKKASFLLFVVSLIISTQNAVAQKQFSTKNATIKFVAKDDKDIDAVNNKAVARLESNGSMSFIMLLKDFHFENELMQDHFNEDYVESDKFPRAFFNGQITNFKSINFSKDGKYPVQVTGNMQVHGTNKNVQTTGTVEVIGKSVKATAKFTVRLKDFNIGGVMIKMVADEIDVDVNAMMQ